MNFVASKRPSWNRSVQPGWLQSGLWTWSWPGGYRQVAAIKFLWLLIGMTDIVCRPHAPQQGLERRVCSRGKGDTIQRINYSRTLDIIANDGHGAFYKV